MRTIIESLAEEAERQQRDKTWEPTDADRALAAQAAADLAAAVGPTEAQQAQEPVGRLEDLREALAVLAIATARIHGPLAWLLAAASTALAPVLQWRAVVAEHGFAFGAVEATAAQYVEAEDAVRRLQTVLAAIAT
ncbi:hypothetical protein [Kitasatospora herbaricolor]|uniref:SAV-6107-like HEPN domain-containing protein n=1 Tax=Kitasatospora herbaricolor TaxID=68217 RepID=A0ABZ1WM23_9ACTN|nr:hypothetical protein [Kitasatospora herbaricolor]